METTKFVCLIENGKDKGYVERISEVPTDCDEVQFAEMSLPKAPSSKVSLYVREPGTTSRVHWEGSVSRLADGQAFWTSKD